MRHALILASLALFATSPVLAQESGRSDKKAPPPPATCLDLAASLDFVTATADTKIEDAPRGCSISNFYAGYGPYNRYRIDTLTIQSPNLFADYAQDFFPAELDLNVSGLVISPDTGSLLQNYIIEMQSEPMDIHLAYRWDKQSGDLDIADLSVTTQDQAGVRLAARISGLDIDPDTIDELNEVPGAFEHLVFEIDDARFLSALAGPALVGMLPYDEDPRPLIASQQQAAATFIENLPEANVSPDSKAALITFIHAFPKANGDYTMELRADPGLKVSALDVDDLAALLPLLASLQLAVTHTPAEQP